jgi:hypothetical protein
LSKGKKLRVVKKGASKMWINKRPKKVYFYASLFSKLHIISEAEKNGLLEKMKASGSKYESKYQKRL